MGLNGCTLSLHVSLQNLAPPPALSGFFLLDTELLERLCHNHLSINSQMSEEQLKSFLEKVKSDTELQEKLKAAASAEATVEIAKEAGFSITAEDIQSMQSTTVDMSDAELEAAAGGQRGNRTMQTCNVNPYEDRIC